MLLREEVGVSLLFRVDRYERFYILPFGHLDCLIAIDDRLARVAKINMFGKQTVFVDVWSPNIFGRPGLRNLTT